MFYGDLAVGQRFQHEPEFRQWLVNRIELGKDRFFNESVPLLVTPRMAEIMLERNAGNNRKIRVNNVDGFVRALQAGKWVVHSHGISFNEKGELDNGQHRLIAISKSNVAAAMSIAFGQSAQATYVIDTGTKKTAKDALRHAGFPNYVTLSGLIQLKRMIDDGYRSRTGILTGEEVLEIAESDRERLCDAAAIGCRVAGSLKCSGSQIGVAAYYILAHEPDKVTAFFDRLSLGNGFLGDMDPTRTLRDRILQGKYKHERIQMAGDVVMAWNQWRRGRKTGSSKWPINVEFPKAI